MKKYLILFSLFSALILTGCSNQVATTESNSSAVNETTQNQTTNQPSETTQKETIPAPDFTLLDLEGNSVTLSELKGEKVYIKFWASF